MAKLERDLEHQKSGSDPSRARKRKLARQGEISVPSVAASSTSNRVHGSHRGGPTRREGKVHDQIKGQVQPARTLQGIVRSTLESATKPAKTSRAARPRRGEGEARRGESLFEATAHAETQRVSSPQQGSVPRKNRRVYDARSEADPPVMVRGGMGGMAFGRVASSRLQKQRAPRRRIDVPLKATGAEIRLPSIPMVNLGWRSVSLLMVIMMSACLVLMWNASIFRVSAVEAQGIKRLTVNDLNAVMGTAGKSIFSLNPNILQEALSQAFPELSKVSVRINLPAQVKIVATERQPVISWTQNGAETWVDNDGISFPVRGTPKTALVEVEGYGTMPGTTTTASQEGLPIGQDGLPVAMTSSTPRLRLSSELVASILALGAKMPEGTVLVYDSQHGLGWNDPHGWDVFFGSEDQDTEMKLVVYQALVERLLSEGITPALISVEYVHAPYYRMER